GQISIGDFVMIASFMTGFYYVFFELLWRLRNIARYYVDIKNYFSILDEEIMVKDPEKPEKITEVKGNIDFHHVSFNYGDFRSSVLKDINLSIKAGESVAFVGRSGAGKTTLIKLLLRFYDVSEGEILLDGVNIKNLPKGQLRSYIGIVPQEPILFNNTIGYNIAYGSEKPTQKEIEEATKMANLHEFIEGLPEKYETPVGERGIKLSGGQKQRLAIARMLLSNPKIIVFDEATSNLDSESEKLIQEALWKVAQGRTVLIIAHRFSTVRKADKIVVLEDGKIVQVGSHKELIADSNGLYHYLWNLQIRGGESQLGDDENLLNE
ncbi:MAG: ABC transporter ATP-binding protein, partial [Microgenomates group bacterium]